MRNVGLRTTAPIGDPAAYRSEAPAIRALERKGFAEPFTVDGDVLRLPGSERTFSPEELCIVDYFRFEGTSDPDDMSVIYALEASDGTRGYLVDAFGTYADPHIGAVVSRIPTARAPVSARWPWWTTIAAFGALCLAIVGLALCVPRRAPAHSDRPSRD